METVRTATTFAAVLIALAAVLNTHRMWRRDTAERHLLERRQALRAPHYVEDGYKKDLDNSPSKRPVFHQRLGPGAHLRTTHMGRWIVDLGLDLRASLLCVSRQLASRQSASSAADRIRITSSAGFGLR